MAVEEQLQGSNSTDLVAGGFEVLPGNFQNQNGPSAAAEEHKRGSRFSWKTPQLPKRLSSVILNTRAASGSTNADSIRINSTTLPLPNASNIGHSRQNSQSNETTVTIATNTSSSGSIDDNSSTKTGSLAKSLHSLKRTTKSILFLDSTATSPVSHGFEIDDHAEQELRRRLASTDSELKSRRSVQSINLADVNRLTPEPEPQQLDFNLVETKATDVDDDDNYDNYEQDQVDDDDRDTISDAGEFDESPERFGNIHINRQRSRTLNSLENTNNPLNNLANSNSTGILASIANFVKLNRATSSSSLRKSSITSQVTTFRTKDALSLMEDKTPDAFLDVLLDTYPINQIVSILSLKDNDFSKDTMQLYFKRYYDFSLMPLDIALRYFLMINDLPKETQQIDRVVYQFAKYYIDQMKSAYLNTDSVYILTFSLIMLNTDRFNPNNKKKMTRFDFIHNVDDALKENGNIIEKDFIGYLFDNIVHSPFIKISQEQSSACLQALENGDQIPYPLLSFLNTDPQQQQQQQQTSFDPNENSGTPHDTSGSTISRSPSLQQLSISSSTHPQLRRRKSSASFLWNSPITMDPYQYIVERSLASLSLPKPSFNSNNPFLNTKTFEKDNDAANFTENSMIQDTLDEYMDETFNMGEFMKILDSITKSKADLLLKVSKSKGSFLTMNKFAQTIPLNDAKDYKNEYLVTRVLKVGILNRQESKTLTNIKTWKKYFCILTPLGLFMFKSISLFKMIYSKSAVIIEESESTGLLDQFQPAFSINRGSFASRKLKNLELDKIVNSSKVFNTSANNNKGGGKNNNLQHYTFFIYGQNTNTAFMVNNIYELRSWILNINMVNALNGVKLPHEKLELGTFVDESTFASKNDKYYEITPNGDDTIEERLFKTCESIDYNPETFEPKSNCNESLWHQIQYMKLLELLTPLESKSRETLLGTCKILNIKIEWMWFEKCRSRVVMDYLRKAHLIFASTNSVPAEITDDLVSSYDDEEEEEKEEQEEEEETEEEGDTTVVVISSPRTQEEADDYYSCLELSL